MTSAPMPPEELERLRQVYVDMVGFVPPKVEARLADLSQADPELLRAQESLRSRLLDTPHLDPQTVQLILVAVLGSQLREATAIHIAAALRAGAGEEAIRAALGLAYLFTGQSVANHTTDYLEKGRALFEKGRASTPPAEPSGHPPSSDR